MSEHQPLLFKYCETCHTWQNGSDDACPCCGGELTPGGVLFNVKEEDTKEPAIEFYDRQTRGTRFKFFIMPMPDEDTAKFLGGNQHTHVLVGLVNLTRKCYAINKSVIYPPYIAEKFGLSEIDSESFTELLAAILKSEVLK